MLNKVNLIGHIGQSPKVSASKLGDMIVTFSLATISKRKGEKVTQWHNCVAFGKVAETISEYTEKGSKLFVEGSINYESYDKDGEKRYSTKIIVNNIVLLNSKEKPQNKSKQSDDFNFDDEIPF